MERHADPVPTTQNIDLKLINSVFGKTGAKKSGYPDSSEEEFTEKWPGAGDWQHCPESRTPYGLSDNPARGSASAPPFFLFHGGMDSLVPFSQAIRFRGAFQAHRVHSELYETHLRGHVTSFLTAGDAVDKAIGFLARQNVD
jgi:acetyl esterase/lipase